MKKFAILLVQFLLLPVIFSANAAADEAPSPPSFVLSATDGHEFSLPEEQKGVAIYFFWASWCPYCRALMPHLQSLKDELGADLIIYALNFRDEEDPQAYIDRSGFDFVVFANADEVATQWEVQGTPGLFVLDSQRRVRFNLLEIMAADTELPADLNHAQRAQRRAPYWASRIRMALDEINSEPSR